MKSEVKNYFLIVFGDENSKSKAFDILDPLSENGFNFLESTNSFIATFQSVFYAKDLEILLIDAEIKFVVCEIIPTLFSANLGDLNKILFLDFNPNVEHKFYEEFVETENKIEIDLTLDELLELVSTKGYDYLTKKQKEKLDGYSKHI